jgi:hypothetical protein
MERVSVAWHVVRGVGDPEQYRRGHSGLDVGEGVSYAVVPPHRLEEASIKLNTSPAQRAD